MRFANLLELFTWLRRAQATNHWRQDCNMEELRIPVSPFSARSLLTILVLECPPAETEGQMLLPNICADVLLLSLQQCHSHGGSAQPFIVLSSPDSEQANSQPSFSCISCLTCAWLPCAPCTSCCSAYPCSRISSMRRSVKSLITV